MSTTWFSKRFPDHAEEALVACLDSGFGHQPVPGTNGNHPCTWKVVSGETVATVSLEEGRVNVSSVSEEFARGVFLVVDEYLNTILIGNLLGGE
jgi:hypothetical protein